jgi:hypothetical protein
MKHQILLSVFVMLAACGCSRKDEMRFSPGTGDAGQFILKQAIARGAAPARTNGCPQLSARGVTRRMNSASSSFSPAPISRQLNRC